MFSKFALASLATSVLAYPQMSVEVDGQQKSFYIVNKPWYQGGGGNKMSLPYGGRSYLATSDKLGPDNFFRPNLAGGSIEYDVDLSRVKCGCNAAFYLAYMPGRHQDGSYDVSKNNDYYCDGMKVEGNYCPELDLMESNQYAWRATAHKCNPPNGGGYFSWCDHNGNMVQIVHKKGSYGPGKSIDTNRPVHAKHTFNAQGWTTELSQGGNKISDQSSDGGYWPSMYEYVGKGMTIAVSIWGAPGTDMKWLDGDTGCQESCDNKPTLAVQNIKIKTGGASPGPSPGPAPPGPSPSPPSPGGGSYTYGDACASPSDCEGGCASCKWSWPSDDAAAWASANAKCRCETTLMQLWQR